MQNSLPSIFVWQISCDDEELGLITSIGVLDVSSDDELEEEVEELVELVEQDLEDSEDSDVTQFKLSFAFIWRHVLSLSMVLLFSDAES